MNQREVVYELVQRHKLTNLAAQRLSELFGLQSEPEGGVAFVMHWLRFLAAGLLGFGAILWVASNWDSMSKLSRFGLIQGALLVLFVLGLLLKGWRNPLSLLSFLCIGGLLACFGQVYQTGADPWQLFALWAVLGLPIAFGVRHDVVWLPWVLVAMTALGLWVSSQTAFWRFDDSNYMIHVTAWVIALVINVGLSQRFQQVTGAGIWARRLAMMLTAIMIMKDTLEGLWIGDSYISGMYVLGVGLLISMTYVLWKKQYYDIFSLSAVVLALNVVGVCGFFRLINSEHSFDTGALFLTALFAAAVLGYSVSQLLKHDRLMKQIQTTVEEV